MIRRKLIAGNWKMHGLTRDLSFLGEIGPAAPGCDILVCPPATLLASFASTARGSGVLTGAQDCHSAESGAHTGDLSAQMLADAGASHVIVGHSERRSDHGETDSIVRAKAEAALKAGLTPILCVGETRAEREAGRAESVVAAQLAGSWPAKDGETIIAYEPVWAIGTGLTACVQDIAVMHGFIRSLIVDGSRRRILYGGSVKPDNARDILALEDVDGALVGGASLDAASFRAIIAAAV